MIKSVVLALLLSVPAMGAMVPAQFRDFSGGLNDSVDATNLQPNQSPDLLNIEGEDPVGSAKPRKGMSLCGNLPSGNTVTELFNYSKNDGSQFVIAADNTNIYQTRDCATWTRLLDNQGGTFKPSFATVRNNLWIVNGSTHAYVWDGATTTILDGGTNTPNPAPPRGRYIEFWRERVWLARTLADPSILAWSALTDSAGNDLSPSTGSLAWPATNAVYIDRDAGSPIYGLKVYRDNLYIFKDNGIWRLVFNNDFDLSVIKTLSSVGCRFGSSIVEIDNLLYFAANDGIYSFDGDNSTRLSDRIANKYASISQPLTFEGTKIWNEEGDFDDGTSTGTDFSGLPGSVILSTSLLPLDGISYNFDNSSSAWTFATDDYTPCVNPGPILSAKVTTSGCSDSGTGLDVPLEETYSGCIAFGSGANGCVGGLTEMPTFNLYRRILDGTSEAVLKEESILGQGTSSISTGTVNLAGISAATIKIQFSYEIGPYGGDSGYARMTSAAITKASAPASIQYIFRERRNLSDLQQYFTADLFQTNYFDSTGTYTTQPYEAVSRSSWSVFDAETQTNGGTIDFYYRLGGSASSILNTTWTAISPGASPVNNAGQDFIQFSATFTAKSDLTETPVIESLSITFLKGGSQSSTIYGGRWKNRYWMTATSDDALSTYGSSTTWDTTAQWSDATLTLIDTTTYSGKIAPGLESRLHDDFGDLNSTASPVWGNGPGTMAGTTGKLRPTSTASGGNARFSTSTLMSGEWTFDHTYGNGVYANAVPGAGANYYGMIFQFIDNATSYGSAANTGGAYFVQIKAASSADNPSHIVTLSTAALDGLSGARAQLDIASYTLTAGNYNAGTHSYRIIRDNDGLMTVYIDGARVLQGTDTTISSSTRMMVAMNDESNGSLQGVDNIYFKFPSSGTWLSAVTDLSDIDLVQYTSISTTASANDGTITMAYRNAATEAALYSTALTTVTDLGSVTGGASKPYFQLQFYLTSGNRPSVVDTAAIRYISRSQRTDGLNNMVLVNSKYDRAAWTPYDMMVGPMMIFSDNFYAAASTHSAIYRMDYGTNDNGQAIPWYWTSRDEVWGQPMNRKRLLEITTDFRKASAASSIDIGYSRDQGEAFTNSTVNMSGTGRASDRRFISGGNSYDYRLRFGSTQLDAAPTIIGITGWSNIYESRH